MIETPHLIIEDRQLKDIPTEEMYMSLYPEIKGLDPSVGECRNPLFYSIFTKGVNRHIGTCCMYNLTTANVELGVRIFNPEYWDKGYGTEVVNALCEHAFTRFPSVTAILVKTPVYNVRATKCYEKCGFVEHSLAIVGGYEMVYMMRPREVTQ